MPYFHKPAAALILGLSLLAPSVVSATVITESFAIQVPSGTLLGNGVNVASSSFQQFDPAMGTLTEIQTVFAGSGFLNGSSASPRLDLSLVVHNAAIVIGGEQFFFSPGGVQFSLGGTDQHLPELGSFIGSGTAQVDLRVLGNGGTFSTPLTAGSITYVYDSATAVPEPAGLWLFGVGLLALATMRGKWFAKP